jgi:monoamine oxidase
MRSLFYGLHRRFGTKISGSDRQDFVQKKMNSEARNLCPTDAEARRYVPRGAPRPRVAIVGGGFSGLMAGYSLAKSCDVTVFEAVTASAAGSGARRDRAASSRPAGN